MEMGGRPLPIARLALARKSLKYFNTLSGGLVAWNSVLQLGEVQLRGRRARTRGATPGPQAGASALVQTPGLHLIGRNSRYRPQRLSFRQQPSNSIPHPRWLPPTKTVAAQHVDSPAAGSHGTGCGLKEMGSGARTCLQQPGHKAQNNRRQR